MDKHEIFKILTPYFSEKEIFWVISKITGFTKKQLFFLDTIELSLDQLQYFIEKRKRWIPYEYCIESAEFFGYEFFVDERCLIPRNDTEVLVQQAIHTIDSSSKNYSLIDVWSGSWCIPISVFLQAKAKGILLKNNYIIDISKKALEVSTINIEKYDLMSQFQVFQSDLLSCFFWENAINISKNVILSANLPYIKNGDFLHMESQVYSFEPEIALFWGENTGFELYEKLTLQIQDFKKMYDIESLIAFYEIGFDQYEYSKQFLSWKWLKFEYFQDSGTIYRCIKIEF